MKLPEKGPRAVTMTISTETRGKSTQKTLIDGGACLSCLCTMTCEKLKAKKIRLPSLQLVFAGGQKYQSDTGAVLDMEFGPLKWKWIFRTVDNLSWGLLLGRDFLENSGCSIDYDEGEMALKRAPKFNQRKVLSNHWCMGIVHQGAVAHTHPVPPVQPLQCTPAKRESKIACDGGSASSGSEETLHRELLLKEDCPGDDTGTR